MIESDRINNSFRNIFYGLLKYGILFIFPFILRTTIIYKFGIEYVGISGLFSSILQVLNLSELGLSTVICYEMYAPVAKNDKEKICKLLSFYKKIYLAIGTFILFAGFLISPFLQELINGTYPDDININIIFLLLLINASCSYLICGYKSTLFVVHQRDDMTSKIQLASNVCMYAFQMFSIFVIENYYAYTVSIVLGTLVNNYLINVYSHKMFPDLRCRGNISETELMALKRKIGSLFGHQLDVVIIMAADNIVISYFLGLKTLAIYSNYYVIISALIEILRMVANSFAASIGNSIAIETRNKNYDSFIRFAYFIVNLAGLCSILMFVLFQDFMTIWMGEDFLLDNKVVFLLSIGFFVRFLKRPGNMFKDAMGLWDKDMLKPYVAGLTNLVFNIFLVQSIGLYGVIISTIISMLLIEQIWETYVLFCFYFKTGIKKYIRSQIVTVFKLAMIGIVTYFIMNKLSAENIEMFVVKACLSGALVTVLFITFSFRDLEFKYIMLKLKYVLKIGATNNL